MIPAGQETGYFELQRRGAAIEVGPAGVRHPRSARFGGSILTPWDAVTHVAASRAGIRLGTRNGVFLFRALDFRDPGELGPCAEALRRGASSGACGAERADRMALLDDVASRPGRAQITGALVLLCAVGFVLQAVWPGFHHEGYFSRTLVRVGEPWRIVTANLLHASLAHLLLNAAGIAVLGWLAERSLGTTRAALVAGAAGLGAMLGSYVFGYERALGASGIVYGLVGALLCLEFRWPESIPVQWRLPRRAFLLALAIETGVLLGAPGIAHAAHWGGFAGGALAVAWVGPRTDAVIARGRRERPVRWAAALLAVGIVLGLGAFLRNVASPDAEAVARRGERLLALDAVAADLLNNEAWQIAVADAAESGHLDVAQRMAERAVSATDASDPAFLDTLAEIHFRGGRSEQALELIEAAILLAPSESYYREQRRRFLGERAVDDRPADPRWPPSPPPALPPGPPPVRV